MLESVERGEWKSAGGGKRERYRVSDTAHSRYNALNRRLVNFRRAAECAQALSRIERGHSTGLEHVGQMIARAKTQNSELLRLE